jgi:prepilin-type N-terminal cleavage/methylation domain-containing protein
MKTIHTKNNSFTLIELLVVIAIIGLLSSIVLVSTQGSRAKARIAKGLEFSQTIQNTIGSEAVGIWDFDNCTASDASGYGNNGTINGAVCSSDTPYSATGKNSMSFDGVDDYISANIPQLSTYTMPVTISAWIYVPSTWTWINGTIAAFPATSYGMGIYRVVTNNLIVFTARIGGGVSYGWINYNIQRDIWYHLMFTGNGATFDAYVNGVKINTSSAAYGVAAGADITGVFQLATSTIYGGGGGGYFGGLIDDVRVYSQVLSQSQIQQLYAEELGGHKDLVME